MTESGRRCYRIIGSQDATLDDFKSAKALGKPLRDQAHAREWEGGVSVFDSLEYAIQGARAFRFALGRFVIGLHIPEDGSVEVAQTGKDRHHFTVYADPERLLSLVVGNAVRIDES